ncbi:hypothetical protein [Actinomadura rupiterrae]|uniref:hypothetical protein n=1 Tax=Actinomadura rupiterrae TaxID=559627 RepID=UPI0020A32909|nr:hypothetical protein [Actinomadura rupiterrae]MCP2337885.1 hypothetical protein [Actinomadura rupiterrae]
MNPRRNQRPAAEASVRRAGPVRQVAGTAWQNRPSLGAWMFLLGAPGGAQLAFGCPWWVVAAVQWPLYAALWTAVVAADLRHHRGEHHAPAVLSEPTQNGGAS